MSDEEIRDLGGPCTIMHDDLSKWNATPRVPQNRSIVSLSTNHNPFLISRNCRGKFPAERDESASSYESESVQRLAKGGKEGR
jgi:hypothetical protein